jgi:hypothetical protein
MHWLLQSRSSASPQIERPARSVREICMK